MHAFGAAYHGALLPPSSPPAHNRSVSLGPPQSVPTRNSISKAKSTNALRQFAMANAEREEPFQTLQDPRNSSTSVARRDSSASRHPELNDEVATLSDKLIKAINHQQALDDLLAQARHELQTARAQIAELEAREKEHQENLSRGDLLTKEAVEKLHERINADLADERRQKSQVQQEKRGIETELENLTASLFDEANKMVAAANMEKEATEKKNQQLRDQIKDEEAVIASQSEQLAELKSLLQQNPKDHRKDQAESPRDSLGPSSPVVDQDEQANVTRLLEAMNLTPVTPDLTVQPSPSTKFTHLIRAQCRVDIPAYEDFRNLLQTSTTYRSHNPSHAPSRAGSGSYGGLNVIGLGTVSYGHHGSSSSNLPQTTNTKLANSPSIPGSFSPRPGSAEVVPLKDTRFFKRVMTEDVETTLRLDLSPTISWLSRRTILAAIGDNALSVEPIPESSLRLYGKLTACSLCGDSRKEGQNPRTHAMRVREGEGATKWPICTLCLEKVRAVGDLIGYIRMVRDGVVKVGDQREEEEVWEELVRLRERVFWARMAGGVVPAFVPSNKNSPVVESSGDGKAGEGDDKENKSDGSSSAADSPKLSQDGHVEGEEEDEASRLARLQLQAGLEEVTTFENAAEQHRRKVSNQSMNELKSGAKTPPVTPPRKRESGAFPRISIPRIPAGFWEGQVNTLH